MQIDVLDHGYVKLLNISGPIRRPDEPYDADDIDPAHAARVSYDASDKVHTRKSDLRLCEYLMKNRHTTPFEMIEIWLEMKMPIFAARQFVRHRTVSINEVSARYVTLPNEFYIPVPEAVGVKSASNKQGRTVGKQEPADLRRAQAFAIILRNHSKLGYAQYEHALENGIPNELARCFLPLNIYTKWWWKQDLHNIMHFLRLRMDKGHAQWEAVEYGNAVFKILESVLPETMRAFRDRELS